MTLTFITNFVHHHQLPLADEFYNILGNDYHFIATKSLPEWLIKGGYDPNLDRPYIVRAYLTPEKEAFAQELIDSSDVVISGDAPLDMTIRRKKAGKVTFHNSERLYRNGVPWLKLPWHAIINYIHYGQYKNTYMLCASAFTAIDYAHSGCFINKCFKWGYFTKVDENFKVEAPELGASTSEITPLMWCARFLKLKHPELPVQLAARLKAKGYHFVLDMFGSGEELESTKKLISDYGVGDCVRLCGNRPNDEILQEMRNHRIFLFTSDRNEGWGAVLNESMANGCVPVASDSIGSVPYLINNGRNGLCFRSEDIDSLEKAVCYLLDNPELIYKIACNAVETMQKEWSPRVAANKFLNLAKYALEDNMKSYTLKEGPSSRN